MGCAPSTVHVSQVTKTFMNRTTIESTDSTSCLKNCQSVSVEIVVFEGNDTSPLVQSFNSGQIPRLVLAKIYNDEDGEEEEEEEDIKGTTNIV